MNNNVFMFYGVIDFLVLFWFKIEICIELFSYEICWDLCS